MPAAGPSVRSGPFVGIIDELGMQQAPPLDAAESRRVADAIAGHLATSAQQ